MCKREESGRIPGRAENDDLLRRGDGRDASGGEHIENKKIVVPRIEKIGLAVGKQDFRSILV